MGQYVVTLLSEIGSCRLNMDILYARTSGLSIHLCKGNPLAALGCLLRNSTLYVLKLPVDISTLGVADHHSSCCKGVGTHSCTCKRHD